jgi:ADP-heptose:LPS heptosyltransferase
MNSAVSALSSAFPGIKIDLLLPAAYAEVMSRTLAVSEVIPVFKKKYITRPWILLQLISNLRRRKYSLAIDCSDVNSHSFTGAMYTILSGARITAGWRISKRRLFDIEVERYTRVIHASDMYLHLISGIFGRELKGNHYFDINKGKNFPAASSMGINCGGRSAKRWALQNFVDVGRKLGMAGYSVDFILGPEEDKLRSELNTKLPENCRLLPLLPLSRLMDFISQYGVFISSDTGPMHLAWCLRVPVIAIFVGSELEKFKPLSPGSVAIDARYGVEPYRISELAIKALTAGKVTA